MKNEHNIEKDPNLASSLLNLLHQSGYLGQEKLLLLSEPEQLDSLATFLTDPGTLVEMLAMFDVKITLPKLEEIINLSKQITALKVEAKQNNELITVKARALLNKFLNLSTVPAAYLDKLLTHDIFLTGIEESLTEEIVNIITTIIDSIDASYKENSAIAIDYNQIKGEVLLLQLNLNLRSVIENNSFIIPPDFIEQYNISSLHCSKRGSFIIYKDKDNKQLATLELLENGTILAASLFDRNKIMLIPRIDRYLNPINDSYDLIIETASGLQYIKNNRDDNSHSQIAHRDSRTKLFENAHSANSGLEATPVSHKMESDAQLPSFNKTIYSNLKGKLIFLQLDAGLIDSIKENKYELPLEWIKYYQIQNVLIKQDGLTNNYVDKNYQPLATLELLANGFLMHASFLRPNLVILVPRIGKDMNPVADEYDLILYTEKGIVYIKRKDDVMCNSQIATRDSRVETLVQEAMEELFPKK